MEWNAAAILGLRTLIAQRTPYTQIGVLFGVSRSAIAGAVRRHIHHNHDNRNSIRRRNAPKPNAVTHHGLVEPWAQYTARKQKERAAARASALQVTSTGPRQEAD